MKRHITFLSALLLSLSLDMLAQEEVFPIGTTWKEVTEEGYRPEVAEWHTPMDTLKSAHVYTIWQERELGQHKYKLILRDGEPWDCAIREEGGRVWMLANGYTQEFLLYDFNWEGRDTIVTQFLHEQDRYAWWWVKPEDHKLILAQATEQHGMEVVDEHHRTIIRGLGCVAELNRQSCLLGHRTYWITPPSLIFWRVLWLRRNGVEVYRYFGKNEWTAPAMGIEERSADGYGNRRSVAYDLQGRRIADDKLSRPGQHRGIVIQDGRKLVR